LLRKKLEQAALSMRLLEEQKTDTTLSTITQSRILPEALDLNQKMLSAARSEWRPITPVRASA